MYGIRWFTGSQLQLRIHVLVVLSMVALVMREPMVESQAGWVTNPPRSVVLVERQCRKGKRRKRRRWRSCLHPTPRNWQPMWRTGQIALLRSGLLVILWALSGQVGPLWLCGWPWPVWFCRELGRRWPWLHAQAEYRLLCWVQGQGQRLLLCFWVSRALMTGLQVRSLAWKQRGVLRLPIGLGMGCLVCQEGPRVEVQVGDDGVCTTTLCGHFTLRVSGDDPFRGRLLLLFLRLLQVPGEQRGSRRTRDSRTPFVRQQYLEQVFGIPQPNISRIEKYWLEGDWPNLLSEKSEEVLTPEIRDRVIDVLATFPWWSQDQAYQHLRAEGTEVTRRQVRQAAEQSGWSRLRKTLKQRYQMIPEGLHFHDGWLLGEMLALVEMLLKKVEIGERLSSQEQVAVTELQTIAAEAGLESLPAVKTLPWLLRVEQVVFGQWEMVTDERVRCIYCGSTQVGRKSKQSRPKRYYDQEGKLRQVAVYRYYCRNPVCDKGSFTNLPRGLVPYSRYRVEAHTLALQMYAWGYSTYRRTATALQVSQMTVYRWVSAWGHELLPMAALYGVVKSSGVVGIDEKYVLVPKNDKPAGKMRRWMYVYMAVDAYTYDLLHIAIYQHNTTDSARAFLLALRVKGYQPRVVVTDLRRDYGAVIARVFPRARHHECIFHALQDTHKHIKDAYGTGYAQLYPEVVTLEKEIKSIFKAKTKRTAQKRYQQVLSQRKTFVSQTAEAAAIFDFLVSHWPILVNGIESKIIPRTNNATEMVIGRFDQHYQNFRGFENIKSAQLFLGVFEKVYRFTPFSQDARPEIRAKCPLELAGYDISQLPIVPLLSGQSIMWPLEASDVPNL